MPFKSKAQRRKFYTMAARGEISKGELAEWEGATGGKKLPERVRKKRGGKKSAARKGSRKRKR